MRAPSLYEYAGSKNALYDLMFADGYHQLLVRIEATDRSGTPAEVVRRTGHLFVEFAADQPARFQLLFQHTAPGLVACPESMALAGSVLQELAGVLAAAGVTNPSELDLWTAMLTGLASQQVSNDPGGDRWLRLVDSAVDRLLSG